ncbi:hypothetical protein [Streptomyces glaucescens]
MRTQSATAAPARPVRVLPRMIAMWVAWATSWTYSSRGSGEVCGGVG